MHLSSYKKMEYMVKFYNEYYPANDGVIKVFDVGSYDKGGTYRNIFDGSGYCYTGMDIHEGPNVDFVPGDIYDWKEIGDETVDVVISGQTFEYIEYPWVTMKEIARILKPSGFCFIIVPSTVHYGAAGDGYRYYADGLSSLAKWADLKVHHTSVGGVPKTNNITDWISEYNDACLVAQKRPYNDIKGIPFEREIRVPVNSIKGYALLREKVKNACDRFVEKKPFVLFGAGWIGDMVLEVLGNDNVHCFVDNSGIKIGTERKGKKVVSFQEYKRDSDKYNCLVTAAESASLAITESLRMERISCQSVFGEL